MDAINKIVVAIDFSEYSLPALRYASALAEAVKAEVVVAHVIDQRDVDAVKTVELELNRPWVDKYIEGQLKERAARVDALLEDAQCTRVSVVKVFKVGHPVSEIVNIIEENGADLLVVGTKGKSNIANTLFGSVAEKLFRKSPVSVLSVRGKEHADLVCKLPD